jgi:hypothetical protein
MQSHTERSKSNEKKPSNSPARDPVPSPEHGSHAHSHAAHLGAAAYGQANSAATFNRSLSARQLREPPQEISRIGKQHR